MRSGFVAIWQTFRAWTANPVVSRRLAPSLVAIGLGLIALFATGLAGIDVKFFGEDGEFKGHAIVLAALSVVVGLALGIVGNDIHRRMVARFQDRAYRPTDLLKNHDLTQAVGLAIGTLLADLADPPQGTGRIVFDVETRAWLRTAAKAAPDRWAAIMASIDQSSEATPWEPLREHNLTALIRRADAPTLPDDKWAETLWSIGGTPPFGHGSAPEQLVVARLRTMFGRALWEVLKNDAVNGGYQAAGMNLLLASQLLNDVNRRTEGNRNPEVVASLEAMRDESGRHAEAVEAKLRSLGIESREILRVVKSIPRRFNRIEAKMDDHARESHDDHQQTRDVVHDEIVELKGYFLQQIVNRNLTPAQVEHSKEVLRLESERDEARRACEDAELRASASQTEAQNERSAKESALAQLAVLSGPLPDPGGPPSTTRAAVDAYNAGVNAQKKSNLKVAEAYYTVAGDLDRSLKKAIYNRGIVKAELGDQEGAIEDYTLALEIDSTDKDALNNRGAAKAELGDQEGAIEDYTLALEIDPDDKEVRYNCGVAKYMLGRYEEAIVDYTLAIEIDQRYKKALINRGNARAELGLYKEAIADYDRVLDTDPHRASAHFNKACAYARETDLERSVASLQRAIELDVNLREVAGDDPYFDSIREHPTFRALVGH